MTYLSTILIYPIKSLDGVALEQATMLPGGAIAQDREFALVDGQGNVVNAKRTAHIQQIRATFDLPHRRVTLTHPESPEPQTFHLDQERSPLEAWFSQVFGYPVFLQQNLHMGFPDDVDASGPTIISVATLKAVASWFNLPLEEVRQRFRANLEVEGVPAFWEDQLYTASGSRPFEIGSVSFLGTHPCQRCIVPTRNPLSGEKFPDFQKIFTTKRQETLPDWAAGDRFNHFYKLTVNTKVSPSEAGKLIKRGDPISLGVPLP